MSKEFDFLIFFTRAQPFHAGHASVVEEALERAERVILFVGSANRSRCIRNPFTYVERQRMIMEHFRWAVEKHRLLVEPLDDIMYNDTAWIAETQKAVNEIVLEEGNEGGFRNHGLKDFKVGIIGHNKDRTSHYLTMFPEWEAVLIKKQFGTFSATDIRADYFRRNPILPHDVCPASIVATLKDFRLSDAFKDLVAEAEFIADYKKSWEAAPFPPTFVTVDAVCVQAGHVLLIRRGGQPGKGLLALPGGFIDAEEPIRDAVIRELREETKISDHKGEMPPALLSARIADEKTRVFDDPDRSQRGRTITHAFLFELPDSKKLYSIKGSDDAAEASWHRLGTLDPTEMYEDHYYIIQEMTGV